MKKNWTEKRLKVNDLWPIIGFFMICILIDFLNEGIGEWSYFFFFIIGLLFGKLIEKEWNEHN